MMRVSRMVAAVAAVAVGVLGLTTTSWASAPSETDSNGRAIIVACPDGSGGSDHSYFPGSWHGDGADRCIPLADALAEAASNGIPDDLILLRPGFYCPVVLPDTHGRLWLQGIPEDGMTSSGGAVARSYSEAEGVIFSRYAKLGLPGDPSCDPSGDAMIQSTTYNQLVFLQNLSADGADVPTSVGTPDSGNAASYGIRLSNQNSYVRDVVVKGARVGMKIDGGSVTHSAFVNNLYEGLETGGQRSTWVQDTLITGTRGGPSRGYGIGLIDGATGGFAATADTLVNVTITDNSKGLAPWPGYSNSYNNIRNSFIAGNDTDCDGAYAGMNGNSSYDAAGPTCYGIVGELAKPGSFIPDGLSSIINPIDYLGSMEPVIDLNWGTAYGLGDPNNCSPTDQVERKRSDCYIGATSLVTHTPGSPPGLSDWVDLPSEVDFGTIAADDSATRTLTFSNKRDGYVTFRDVSATDGFTIARDDCSHAFLVRRVITTGEAAQPYCTISVTATGTEQLNGSLKLATNHGGTTSIPLVANKPAQTLTTHTPTISGAVKVGATVTAVPGAWTAGTTFTYQWNRAGTAIAGATKSTYTPVAADRGKKLTVSVTGSKTGYTSASKTSAAYTVGYGTLKAATPTISGTAKVGKTLTAHPGTWSAGSAKPKLTYQWYANGAKISGATKSTLKLKTAQKGKKVTVKVTGTASGYTSVSKTSKATAKVAKK